MLKRRRDVNRSVAKKKKGLLFAPKNGSKMEAFPCSKKRRAKRGASPGFCALAADLAKDAANVIRAFEFSMAT